MKEIEKLGDKTIGIDIDGDKKPDFKVDVKSIAIVVGFIISGSMGYQNLKQEIANYLLNLPGNIGLRALKKGLPKEDLNDLNMVISSKKSLLQQAIEPVEAAIHDFTVELLKGLKSVFIANNDEEIIRQKKDPMKFIMSAFCHILFSMTFFFY